MLLVHGDGVVALQVEVLVGRGVAVAVFLVLDVATLDASRERRGRSHRHRQAHLQGTPPSDYNVIVSRLAWRVGNYRLP